MNQASSPTFQLDLADEAESAPSVRVLILQLKALLAEKDFLVDVSGYDRKELETLLRSAARALEEPFEVINRLGYSPLSLVMVRIAQARGVLDIISSATDTGRTWTVPTLARATGIERRFLETMLDYLCSEKIVRRVGEDQFQPTALTMHLTTKLSQDMITFCHDTLLTSLATLNDWLYEPSPRKTAWQIGHDMDVGFSAWLRCFPEQSSMFCSFIESQSVGFTNWLDRFPLDKLDASLRRADYAFVDVAGGNGQHCLELKTALPHIRGRIVSQDIPETLMLAQYIRGVELMSYDLFTLQPIQGARVYYMRHVLHRFSDEDCVRILQNQARAMDENSVLVLDEKVLLNSESTVDEWAVEAKASFNLSMGAIFDTWGRCESQWRKLLASTGLSIREIRRYTSCHDALLIASLGEDMHFSDFSQVFEP